MGFEIEPFRKDRSYMDVFVDKDDEYIVVAGYSESEGHIWFEELAPLEDPQIVE